MRKSFRPSPARRLVAGAAVASLCLVGAPAQVEGTDVVAPRGWPATAGLAGPAIMLADQQDLHGYDIAMDDAGTAYVGWIASDNSAANRTVYLCVLPLSATACQGGVRSTPSLDGASAAGLQVLPPAGASPVTLVWFHDTVDSESIPLGARIATSTVLPGGSLTAAADQAVAYSNGALLTAERGPDGAIWAVVQQAASVGDALRVLPTLGVAFTALDPPWLVGKARLGFAEGKAVLVVDKYGDIDERLQVAKTDPGWSSFSAVPGTWNVGGAFDVAAKGGLKLVAPIDNATYYPRIATWDGSGFGPFQSTGDKNSCHPTSHDLFPDASGRLADVSFECTKVTIANHPKAKTAAFARFGVGGTPAGGDPQIGTNPRGLGWVAWGRLSTPVGNTLLVAPIRLPAQKTSRSASSTAGKVTVTGPVSCLPAVRMTLFVTASPANGWAVVSKTLKVDGTVHGPALDGHLLPAGTTHSISGSAKFAKGAQRKTVTAQLSFTTCPDP